MERYQKIEGEILEIIYSNTDNKYAVIKVQDAQQKNKFNAAGRIQGPKVGAIVQLEGYWEKHRKYGIQFKTVSSVIAIPETLGGIMKYLGSGFVEGVGIQSARNIVEYYGEETANILENDIDKLTLVRGIGPGRLRNIKLAWNEQGLFNRAIKKTLSS